MSIFIPIKVFIITIAILAVSKWFVSCSHSSLWRARSKYSKYWQWVNTKQILTMQISGHSKCPQCWTFSQLKVSNIIAKWTSILLLKNHLYIVEFMLIAILPITYHNLSLTWTFAFESTESLFICFRRKSGTNGQKLSKWPKTLCPRVVQRAHYIIPQNVARKLS